MKIDEKWTFDGEDIADEFDSHVRQQLPWYEMATSFITNIAASYLPQNGTLIDIGASKGNITHYLENQCRSKSVTVHSIEPSKEMVERWVGYGKVHNINAEEFKFHIHKADVYICFLSLMFIKTKERNKLIQKICDNANPGAAVLIVDKCRLNISQVAVKAAHLAEKKYHGVLEKDFVQKELSLRGIQVPTNKERLMKTFEHNNFETEQIFQFGEFYGIIAVKETI